MPSTFRYTPYENTSAGTIAQILGLQGQAAAENARAHGAIAAQTAQTIGNAGQQFMGSVNDILQLKREAPIRALQLQNLQNQVAEGQQKIISTDRAQKLHVILSDAIKANATPQGVNHEGVVSYLQAHDAPELVDEYVKSAGEIDKLLHPALQIVAPGGTAIDKSGKAVFTAPEKTPAPTTASLAVDAANPNSPTHEASATALATLQSPQVETARHNKAMEDAAKLNSGREAAQAAETRRHNLALEAAANPFIGANAAGGQTAAPATGTTGPTGDDLLKTLSPGMAAQIKALAEGRAPFPTGMSYAKLQPLIQMVSQYDPSFDAANYNARNKARTDLTSPNGMGGKSINALNTALQHAGKLSDLIEKLDNYESPVANAVVNPLRTMTGHTEVTNFKAVAPQLMKEIERAWRGTGGSTADIKDLIDSIGQNLGRQQQREALSSFVDLVDGKLNTTQQQRDNIMGPVASKGIPVLFDQNKPIIEKIRQRAGGAAAAASPKIGEAGTVNGQPAEWRNGAQGLGWYAR